jgi:hypothetical protein
LRPGYGSAQLSEVTATRLSGEVEGHHDRWGLTALERLQHFGADLSCRLAADGKGSVGKGRFHRYLWLFTCREDDDGKGGDERSTVHFQLPSRWVETPSVYATFSSVSGQPDSLESRGCRGFNGVDADGAPNGELDGMRVVRVDGA